ncbi:MAG: ABC transporter ATP-binding protein [Bacilli bacterium]|jgi:ATP-binding cassette subfamily B protein|nr:ABC transporter ATP-binding protein [Bacilli bacterium]MDD3389245.1 ABC transporter ATP-binding protein [Bacilli bacterium]MDD4345116.1 ABC transporter ATP-binding protein [Bacilli bacterium]MDD4521051.1 ABC transporter ATP-binding protein [Bacilli bacterium]MDY0399960.1 ABC transporter ATP-binding protein [Bacilli bacterium]
MRDFVEHHEAHQDSRLLLRLLKYLKPYAKKFVLAFFLMIITTFAGMVLPLASGLAIDIMTDPAYTIEAKTTIIFIGTAVILLITGIAILVGYYQNVMLQRIGQEITHQMREEVFTHIEKLSIGQINDLPVGKLVTRATNDPGNISDMFTNTIVNLIRNILMMVIIAVILLFINPLMALVALAVFPLIVIASLFFNKFSRTAYREVRQNVSEINAFLSENLSGMKVTQVFNQEEKKKQQFKIINQRLNKSYIKEIMVFGIYRPLIYFLAMIATILSIYFGVSAIFAGSLTIGLFVSFYFYIGQFFEPVQQIAEQFNSLQSGFASAEKIFDVLDTPPAIKDAEDAITLDHLAGEIEFKNVWFQYIPEEWVLKDISFKVAANETVAFVGATGSGKTTILQLIVRNYDIQKGQILIDGIDIKKIKRSSLRAFVGQMLQDVFLFSGTIRENITLRNENIPEAKILESTHYVGLDQVLKRLPNGLNEEVKERGKNFSAGERQLISFARAVTYQPSVMILDEATANIDSETEAIIQESLAKMMNISTMLIVAHRLSTIQHCDKIFVMHKGEIVETGNHQTLLQKNGLYYNLYRLQYDQQKREENNILQVTN